MRSSRRRSISLEVRHDRRVILRLPAHVSEVEGHRFVVERAQWILRSQNEMLSREHGRLEIRLEQSGVLPWLGRPHRIELQPGIEPQLTEDDGLLLPAPENASLEMQEHCIRLGLDRLIDSVGLPYLRGRLDEMNRLTGLNGSALTLKDYRSRWGSCSHTGAICLNRRLLLCRPEVIDYVIIHELCHLVHLNHSPRFWQLVESHCRGWRRWRDWLKVNTGLLEF